MFSARDYRSGQSSQDILWTETPEKRLRDKDKRRKAYYRLYTDMEWGIAQNYHIALDSGALGVDKCIEIITSLY